MSERDAKVLMTSIVLLLIGWIVIMLLILQSTS
jgi:hypothetical protein